jgi:hypothetical protein
MQKYKFPKRLIFTISSGRSGTRHLTRILGTLPGVGALHEPEPNFLQEMQASQAEFSIAQRFLEEKKLPQLASNKDGIFADISHMWCKGLLQAWLLRDDLPIPDVVVLDRNLRSVALSILRLETTPERTHGGREWYIGPSAASAILKIKDWENWNNYQLCYWYAMEVEARKATLGRWVESRGGRICRIDITDLRKWKGIQRLIGELELPRPGLKEIYTLMWLLREKSNTQGSEKLDGCNFSNEQLLGWENAVHEKTLNLHSVIH